jgi:hypothetical protein
MSGYLRGLGIWDPNLSISQEGGSYCARYFGPDLCRVWALKTGGSSDLIARAILDLQRMGRCAPELGGYSQADCEAAKVLAPELLGATPQAAIPYSPQPRASLPTVWEGTQRCPLAYPVATVNQYGQLICKAEATAEAETAAREGVSTTRPATVSAPTPTTVTRLVDWVQERSITQVAPNWVLLAAVGLGAWALSRKG